MKTKNSIPRTLKPYFQEYDLKKLDVRRDSLLIMQRTLEYGDLDELRWLFDTYPRLRIREFVRTRGELWLSGRSFYFWRRYFKLRSWKHAPSRGLGEILWPV